MYYYKVFYQDKIITITNSSSLRYYNPKSKKMLRCKENLAQYITADSQLYRVGWFQPECKEMIGKYPTALLELATEEEYEKYMAEMAKVESE